MNRVLLSLRSRRRSHLTSVVAGLVLVTGACSSAPSNASPTSVVATVAQSTSSSAGDWVGDLEQIDEAVRQLHPDPFAVVLEDVWGARIRELKQAFPTLNDHERIVGMASLAGLLDTHTQFFGPDQRLYDVWLYRFSDGLFLIAANDPSLVGARLASINGVDADEVEAQVQTLIPSDNESAKLGASYLTAYVDYLHGLGIVDDPTKPALTFSFPDGAERTVDLGTTDADDFLESQHFLGALGGDQNEALRRRGEPIWTRVDAPTKSFMLSLNDYTGSGHEEALAAMTAALDDGTAERVVVDMRYLRGGDGSQLFPVVEALKSDPRVNRPDGLIVLIGRENESAATVIASMFDLDTEALFVGEETPARADNFLCPCKDIMLERSGYIFSVPTSRSGNGDPRRSIGPDVPVALSSVDYFAGRDPALEAALAPSRPVGASAWIAFHQGSGISIIRADGTDMQVVPIVGRNPRHPDWSPDGTQFAYEIDDPGAIWVADRDGSNARRVVECTAPCEIADDPAWSPDGAQLAFWWSSSDGPKQSIDVVDIGTGEVAHSVAGADLIGPVGPRWSPDGFRLVLAAGRFELNGADYELVDSSIGIIDLNDPSPSIVAITLEGMTATYPDWSPSGDRIVFQSGNLSPFDRVGSPPELFTVRPDGTDLTQITHHADGDPWVALPDWSALDGQSVLVTLIHGDGHLTLGRVDMTSGAWSELLDAAGLPILGAHPRSAVDQSNPKNP